MFGAAKTGMLADANLIETVATNIEEHGIQPLVVDPVMVAKSGDRLLEESAKNALIKRILPLANVLTPNLGEAEEITDMTVRTPNAMKEAAKRIIDLGPKSVLIKGGHLEEDAVDIFYDGSAFTPFHSPRIETPNTHGTGCTLSAAIAANLAKGESLAEAILKSKQFITEAIRNAPSDIGSGHGPLDHMWRIRVA